MTRYYVSKGIQIESLASKIVEELGQEKFYFEITRFSEGTNYYITERRSGLFGEVVGGYLFAPSGTVEVQLINVPEERESLIPPDLISRVVKLFGGEITDTTKSR